MARPLASCLSPLVLATLTLAIAPAADAGKRSPAPIEYAGFNSSHPQGEGVQQGSSAGIPQPNSSATRDSWRGPVTRTGSGHLPEQREKISFSYPGAVDNNQVTPSSKQYASVDTNPRAAAADRSPTTWPARANVPTTDAGNTPAINSLTLTGNTADLDTQPGGETFKPTAVGVAHEERGVASWYGRRFHGRLTANGETFDMNAMTAAHPTLPLPSLVQVVNEDNGKEIVVRVNDRGPYADDRVIDLSRKAATALDIIDDGTAPVAVRYLGPAPDVPGKPVELASAEGAVTTESLREVQVSERLSRPNLYGNMLADGFEPSLGVPDPGKTVATPARFEALSVSAAKYTSDTLAGGPAEVASKPMMPVTPPAQQEPETRPEPAARTIYAAASPTPTTPEPRPASKSFGPQIYVQVGAFGDIGNAQEMHTRVGSGFPVEVEDAQVDGSDFFRVLVGPYPTRDAAERAKSQLGVRGVTESFVTLR